MHNKSSHHQQSESGAERVADLRHSAYDAQASVAVDSWPPAPFQLCLLPCSLHSSGVLKLAMNALMSKPVMSAIGTGVQASALDIAERARPPEIAAHSRVVLVICVYIEVYT